MCIVLFCFFRSDIDGVGRVVPKLIMKGKCRQKFNKLLLLYKEYFLRNFHFVESTWFWTRWKVIWLRLCSILFPFIIASLYFTVRFWIALWLSFVISGFGEKRETSTPHHWWQHGDLIWWTCSALSLSAYSVKRWKSVKLHIHPSSAVSCPLSV